MFPSLRTMIFHVNWWKSKYKFRQKNSRQFMNIDKLYHPFAHWRKSEYSQVFPTIDTISTNDWNLPQEYKHLFKNNEHWICSAPILQQQNQYIDFRIQKRFLKNYSIHYVNHDISYSVMYPLNRNIKIR